MKLKKILLITLAILVVLIVAFVFTLRIAPPEQDLSVINKSIQRTQQGEVYKYGNNWIKKEKPGMYYMYVEGDAFERGYAEGILTKELANTQEDFFVAELDKKIPNKIYQFFLKVMIGWFNRDIDEHIPDEYKKEIYGKSLFASKEYNFIAPAYQRLLNYHAAHDIGHAIQNMHLVACTGLGAWSNSAKDSSMYIGRNFDFYINDNFAKNKIIAFVNPKQGHKFMSITWGGMSGVVSGMNMEGLSVSLNADKSEIPSKTGTPVSIIGREILQYASTIDEAFKIAKSHTSFVSESFFIGSTKDHKIAIIEKTPQTTSLYYTNDDRIIIANHFQSDELKGLPINIENINDSTSYARQGRVAELMKGVSKFDEKEIAKILRNPKGLNDRSIGLGNEKAINQFIAHHAYVFNPYKRMAWISTAPYQLGEFLAIDLNKVFENSNNFNSITIPAMNIPADSILSTPTYTNILLYKKRAHEINDYCANELPSLELSENEINTLILSNPDYYHVYKLAGDYYKKKENYSKAISYYTLSLNKEMPSVSERKNIDNKIKECAEKKK